MTAAATRGRRRRIVAAGMLALVASIAACRRSRTDGELSRAQRAAIADTLERLVSSAYDFSRPGAAERMIALYLPAGRLVSASGGHLTTSRDSLRKAIETFWTFVGQNMRDPRWKWEQIYVDVLSPNAAVLTGRYTIQHRTPQGMPHTVGGAWTAVFERRDGRWGIVQEHLSDAPASDSMPGMPGMPGMSGM